MNIRICRAPKAMVSLILGILGLLLAIIPIVGVIVGCFAIIVAIIVLRNIRKSNAVTAGFKTARAGLITGALAVLLGGGWTIYTAIVFVNIETTSQPKQKEGIEHQMIEHQAADSLEIEEFPTDINNNED